MAYQGHPYLQGRHNVELRPQHFSQNNNPSNVEVPRARNYSSEQSAYHVSAQQSVPPQGTPANFSGPQFRPSSQAPFSYPIKYTPIDSQLLQSNIDKENQIANFKATIKSQQDRINLLESERDLLSNRLYIVQSRLEPHSKWNPKYIPELDRMISDLKHSRHPETIPTNLNAIVDHCDKVSTVLKKIFSCPSLHSTAPPIQHLPQTSYRYAESTSLGQPMPQLNQGFPPHGQYPNPRQPPPQAQNIAPHFSTQN